jgi:hypothetical protein
MMERKNIRGSSIPETNASQRGDETYSKLFSVYPVSSVPGHFQCPGSCIDYAMRLQNCGDSAFDIANRGGTASL